MKSLAIKTSNRTLAEYIFNQISNSCFENVYYTNKTFKNYTNCIVHYSGNDNKKFTHKVSCILSCLVIDELEEKFIKQLLLKNYFYFDSNERKHITEKCFEIFTDDFNLYFDKKYNC